MCINDMNGCKIFVEDIFNSLEAFVLILYNHIDINSVDNFILSHLCVDDGIGYYQTDEVQEETKLLIIREPESYEILDKVNRNKFEKQSLIRDWVV